jgi:hypothetical protein
MTATIASPTPTRTGSGPPRSATPISVVAPSAAARATLQTAAPKTSIPTCRRGVSQPPLAAQATNSAISPIGTFT